ncbi:hypothetical protein [Reinekea sp. G2M2-21]|uniref:hypothetical protein n=1 Tax=Reinekea sp. G2M2-21 TaxID=2788942 RepID=UPI0018AA337B|nr:hypothetical protein [Reinekea sp. G2M2-21]
MLIINLLFVHHLSFELSQDKSIVVEVAYLEAIDRGLGGLDESLIIQDIDGKLKFSVGSAEAIIDGVTGCELNLESILRNAEINCDQGSVLLK